MPYLILDNEVLTSGLIVCVILNLAYLKEHVYYILLIYSMIIVPEPSIFFCMIYDHVT